MRTVSATVTAARAEYLARQYEVAAQRCSMDPTDTAAFAFAAIVVEAREQMWLHVYWVEDDLSATGLVLEQEGGKQTRFEGWFDWGPLQGERRRGAGATALHRTGVQLTAAGPVITDGGPQWRPLDLDAEQIASLRRCRLILGSGGETEWIPIFVDTEMVDETNGDE
jgi:hypothetical protein